jgi:hypothetical protein
MAKAKRGWYTVKPRKRLVLVYQFAYEKPEEGQPDYDYDKYFTEFLENNRISSDKILKVVPAGDCEEVHVFMDAGIEQYAIVEFNAPKGYEDKYEFKNGQRFIYMGEIPNMRGHCVVADYETGRIHSGYHIENFKAANEI